MAFEFDMRGIADPAIQGLRSIKDTIRNLGEGYRGTIARAGDKWANQLEADKQRDFLNTQRIETQAWQAGQAAKEREFERMMTELRDTLADDNAKDEFQRELQLLDKNQEFQQSIRDQEEALKKYLQKEELSQEEKLAAAMRALEERRLKQDFELGLRAAETDERMADTAQFRAETERLATLFDQKMQREGLELEKEANEWRQAVAEEANRLQARGLDIDEERLEYEALPEWIKNDFPTFEEWKQWTLDLRSSGTSQDLESQLGIQYAMAIEKTLDALRQTGEEAILVDEEGYMKPWRTLSEEDKQRVLKEFGRIVQNTTNERLLLDMMQEKLEFGAEPEPKPDPGPVETERVSVANPYGEGGVNEGEGRPTVADFARWLANVPDPSTKQQRGIDTTVETYPAPSGSKGLSTLRDIVSGLRSHMLSNGQASTEDLRAQKRIEDSLKDDGKLTDEEEQRLLGLIAFYNYAFSGIDEFDSRGATRGF